MGNRKQLRPAVVPAILGLTFALVSAAALGNEEDRWSVTAGVGVVSLPRFPGSDLRRTAAIPVLSIRYGRFFIGGVPGSGTPAGLGAYLHEDPHWKLGVALGGDVIEPRRESDDRQHLRGLGDINGTVRGGAFASYTLGWFSLRGGAFWDLEDHHNHEGLSGSVEAVARFKPLERLTITTGPAVTFANRRHMQTFFGVDAVQSARSGYAQYAPRAGVPLGGLALEGEYEMTHRWTLGASLFQGRLTGDAERSPFIQAKRQSTYTLFVLYKFR